MKSLFSQDSVDLNGTHEWIIGEVPHLQQPLGYKASVTVTLAPGPQFC
jgi:hypothetical protein